MNTPKHIRCYDNGGKTCDRYTVVYMKEPRSNGLFNARAMNHQPFHPQGFGQSTTAKLGRHLGKRIKFSALPEDCRKLVMQDLAIK
jgi:hypothetical protein